MDCYDAHALGLADEPRGLAPAPVAEADWDGLKAWLAIEPLYPPDPAVEAAWAEFPHLHRPTRGRGDDDGRHADL